jgi:hypothetical protein
VTTKAEAIANLLDHAVKDIVIDVDGYRYYWPSGNGHLSAWMLRAIADELDRLNKPLDDEIAAFFASQDAATNSVSVSSELVPGDEHG